MQGLKPRVFRHIDRSAISAALPRIRINLTARLKPCPFKTIIRRGLSCALSNPFRKIASEFASIFFLELGEFGFQLSTVRGRVRSPQEILRTQHRRVYRTYSLRMLNHAEHWFCIGPQALAGEEAVLQALAGHAFQVGVGQVVGLDGAQVFVWSCRSGRHLHRRWPGRRGHRTSCKSGADDRRR